jgi:hypothetical protein
VRELGTVALEALELVQLSLGLLFTLDGELLLGG